MLWAHSGLTKGVKCQKASLRKNKPKYTLRFPLVCDRSVLMAEGVVFGAAGASVTDAESDAWASGGHADRLVQRVPQVLRLVLWSGDAGSQHRVGLTRSPHVLPTLNTCQKWYYFLFHVCCVCVMFPEPWRRGELHYWLLSFLWVLLWPTRWTWRTAHSFIAWEVENPPNQNTFLYQTVSLTGSLIIILNVTTESRWKIIL